MRNLVLNRPFADRAVHVSHVCLELSQGSVAVEAVGGRDFVRICVGRGQKLRLAIHGPGIRSLADLAELVQIAVPAVGLGIVEQG